MYDNPLDSLWVHLEVVLEILWISVSESFKLEPSLKPICFLEPGFTEPLWDSGRPNAVFEIDTTMVFDPKIRLINRHYNATYDI